MQRLLVVASDVRLRLCVLGSGLGTARADPGRRRIVPAAPKRCTIGNVSDAAGTWRALARRRDAARVRPAPRARPGSRDVQRHRRDPRAARSRQRSRVAARRRARRSKTRTGMTARSTSSTPGADRMIALAFGKRVAPRDVTLTLAFTGDDAPRRGRPVSPEGRRALVPVLARRIGVRAADHAVLRRAALEDTVARDRRGAERSGRRRQHAGRARGRARAMAAARSYVRGDAADAELPARGRGRAVRRSSMRARSARRACRCAC